MLSNISGSTFIEERKERVREREGGPYQTGSETNPQSFTLQALP